MKYYTRIVALFTRAWIEIEYFLHLWCAFYTSPSLRGRGLKFLADCICNNVILSPSLRGRGLKFHVLCVALCTLWSPSLRGRGLKYTCCKNNPSRMKSPSLRGRGLKCNFLVRIPGDKDVALFTRAWSEIFYEIDSIILTVVALFTRAWIEMASQKPSLTDSRSPSSRGRGLKFDMIDFDWDLNWVALFTRAWIEIRSRIGEPYKKPWSPSSRGRGLKYRGHSKGYTRTCRPLHEGVD